MPVPPPTTMSGRTEPTSGQKRKPTPITTSAFRQRSRTGAYRFVMRKLRAKTAEKTNARSATTVIAQRLHAGEDGQRYWCANPESVA